MKAVFRKAVPYAKDALNLPVGSVAEAVPYYQRVFGFTVESREAAPHARALLSRDAVRIGLAENGGDPTQEGCFFEVSDLDAAHAEIAAGGGKPGGISVQPVGKGKRRAFFVVAPDGLCFMLAEPESA